jgi:hypothetical protein
MEESAAQLSVYLSAKLSGMNPTTLRRTRRSDSLATAVIELLDDFQCPVSTSAVRIILNDRGRVVTAENLSRLAAYQREDFLRTRIPPELCSALEPNGVATNPRWWARGDWRLDRRILTEDVKPIWIATLAERLCLDLAQRPNGRDLPIMNLTLGAVAQVTGGRYFDVPLSGEEWMTLRAEVYGRYMGAFSNRAGATSQQHDAEARLIAAGLSSFDLLFGRPAE